MSSFINSILIEIIVRCFEFLTATRKVVQLGITHCHPTRPLRHQSWLNPRFLHLVPLPLPLLAVWQSNAAFDCPSLRTPSYVHSGRTERRQSEKATIHFSWGWEVAPALNISLNEQYGHWLKNKYNVIKICRVTLLKRYLLCPMLKIASLTLSIY